MLHYFLSRQSNKAEQHVKKALFFHRPTYKWAWFCSAYWSAFFSWEQKSSVKGTGCHCCEITRAAMCMPGDTWASRAGQLCSAARPAPLLAPKRCLFLFCWEVPGSFREHTWFAPNSTPSARPAEPSPLTLVPCVVYSGSDLVLPSSSSLPSPSQR